ncbi:MAG: hypothetical protein E7384_07330 [Ruminococcaceae bacterium]|nr:hypothetical protein [Oscillospiraceae bacterium]
MKKILSISAVVLIIAGVFVWIAFSFFSESLVIKNIKSDHLSEKEISEYFQEKFVAYDYLNIFDKKNDVIVVDYEHGYTVNYYSTRDISAKNAGYIQACIKQAGIVSENGQVFPTLTKIHSETDFNKKAEITQATLYTVSSQKAQAENDETDESFYGFSDGSSIINGSDRLNVIEDFGANKENSTDEWKTNCIEEMHNAYIETTNKFNSK